MRSCRPSVLARVCRATTVGGCILCEVDAMHWERERERERDAAATDVHYRRPLQDYPHVTHLYMIRSMWQQYNLRAASSAKNRSSSAKIRAKFHIRGASHVNLNSKGSAMVEGPRDALCQSLYVNNCCTTLQEVACRHRVPFVWSIDEILRHFTEWRFTVIILLIHLLTYLLTYSTCFIVLQYNCIDCYHFILLNDKDQ